MMILSPVWTEKINRKHNKVVKEVIDTFLKKQLKIPSESKK